MYSYKWRGRYDKDWHYDVFWFGLLDEFVFGFWTVRSIQRYDVIAPASRLLASIAPHYKLVLCRTIS